MYNSLSKKYLVLIPILLLLIFLLPDKAQVQENKINEEYVIGSWWTKIYYPKGHPKIRFIRKGTKIYFENAIKAKEAGFKPCEACYDNANSGEVVANTTIEYNVNTEGLNNVNKIDLSRCISVYCWQVIDPQTLRVQYGDEAGRIRIIGVSHLNNSAYPDMKFTKDANLYLEEKLQGKWIYLAFDKYWYDERSRIPAYILTGDGELINLTLIKKGIMKVDNTMEFQFSSQFRYYERKAKLNHFGLWRNEQ